MEFLVPTDVFGERKQMPELILDTSEGTRALLGHRERGLGAQVAAMDKTKAFYSWELAPPRHVAACSPVQDTR